jgi:crotonobetaine/carnitine-CoA ligase
MNLIDICRHGAERWDTKTAAIFDLGDTRLTFGDIERATNRYARALDRLGVQPGDAVGVMLPNRAEFALVWLGLVKLGAVTVPLNTRYRDMDAAYVLQQSRAVAAITAVEFEPLLTRLSIRVLQVDDVARLAATEGESDLGRSASPQDTVSIQFTSGTTGAPKGCVLSHSYWSLLIDRLISEFPRFTENDVLLTAQPFYYLDPQWNLATALGAGASVVVLDGFHPSTFWMNIRKHRATFFYCLGNMPKLLIKVPRSNEDHENNVRLVACSGIPPQDHRELEARWGAPWHELSGMTETGADMYVSTDEHDDLVGSGCVGRPYKCREARVVDDDDQPVVPGRIGHLIYRGPGMMDGYFADPRADDEVFRDGWFHTGDLGRMDEFGRFYYTGRGKDVIRRSGESIAATEIEGVLLSHPLIRMVACVSVPDDIRGEEIKAYVVLQDESAPEEGKVGELAAFCGERLATFKVPRYWEFRRNLPMTASERVAKADLVANQVNVARTFDRIKGVWK